MNKYEIDVPIGRAEEWRAHVASFEGAQIVKDGGKIDAEKQSQERLYEGIIAPIREPVSEENLKKVSQSYNRLFGDAFRHPLGPEIVEKHLESPDDLRRAGVLLYDLFHSKGKVRSPHYLAYLVKRYGLVTGEPMDKTKAAIEVGFSPKYIMQQLGPEGKALLAISLDFSRDRHPDVIKTQSRY